METDIEKRLKDCLIDFGDVNNQFRTLLVDGGEKVPMAYNKGIEKAIQVVKDYFNELKPL